MRDLLAPSGPAATGGLFSMSTGDTGRQKYKYKSQINDEIVRYKYFSTPPYYKYTKKEYAKKFFDGETLRVGTLYDYADHEKHSAGILDLQEGFYLRDPEKFKNVDVATLEYIMSINSYIFCVSSNYSPSLLKKFKADCCYRINDNAFFTQLTKSFFGERNICKTEKVLYIDKFDQNYAPEGDLLATFIKHKSYRSQFEVRAMWETIDKPPPMQPQPLHVVLGMTPDEFNGLPNERAVQVALSKSQAYREYVMWERRRIRPKDIAVAEAPRYCTPMGSLN